MFISDGVNTSDKKLSSKTTPISSFIVFSFFLLSNPNTFISPILVLIKFSIDFIVVLFPAPFSPIKPIIIPFGRLKLMFFNSKLLYFLDKFLTSSIFSILVIPPHIKYLAFLVFLFS